MFHHDFFHKLNPSDNLVGMSKVGDWFQFEDYVEIRLYGAAVAPYKAFPLCYE